MDDSERAVVERFDRQYRLGVASVQREVEQAVLGADYGATSYTTVEEASDLGRRLRLGPDSLLLDMGTGSGWPGLYLAATTGCRVVLTDKPIEGLLVARQRAKDDARGARASVVGSAGEALPFRRQVFDAVTHTDVLCWLEPKLSVLRACRRVLRPGGRMAFHTITVARGLSEADRTRAIAAGPPHVTAPAGLADLLVAAGFREIEEVDVTRPWRVTAAAWLHESARVADRLEEVYGSDDHRRAQQERQENLDAIDAGLLERSLFVARTG